MTKVFILVGHQHMSPNFEINGVFSNHEAAVTACRAATDSVTEVNLDEDLTGRDPNSFPTEFPLRKAPSVPPHAQGAPQQAAAPPMTSLQALFSQRR